MIRTAGRYLRWMHVRSMHSTSGVCVCCLASNGTDLYGMMMYGLRKLTKQPKLTAIIQSRRLTLFGHIMHMDDNADAKRILLASPPADWRRQLGCPASRGSAPSNFKHLQIFILSQIPREPRSDFLTLTAIIFYLLHEMVSLVGDMCTRRNKHFFHSHSLDSSTKALLP